ncbi:MAG: hypothetical protein E6K13_09930, partial [Methanobacteriota archaeon]
MGAISWDGTTFTVIGATTFTTNAGTVTYEVFDLKYRVRNVDQLLVRYDWTGVPPGDTYTLQIKGFRTDEDINIQVLTPPSTWNTRSTVSAMTNTMHQYTLTSSEYNGGSPSVRFVDANGPGSPSSDFYVDYANIVTNIVGAANTPASTETIITGSKIAGTFPTDIQSANSIYLQYREALAPVSDHYPGTETVTTGSGCGGTFPTELQSSNNAYRCLREGAVATPDEIGAIGYKSKDPTGALITYRSTTGANGASAPKTRAWDGSVWSAEAEQTTAGSPVRAVRSAWSPAAPTQRIIVTLSDDGWLDAYVCDVTCAVTNNIGQVWSVAPANAAIPFDVAYESTSGDALLVYGVLSANTAQDIAYKTYVGGMWSAEQYLDDAGHATDIQYSLIKLASKKTSDQIGLVGGDDTNDDANVWIWDGSAFGNFVEITASMRNPVEEEVAIAWETNSGHLLAVASDGALSDIDWREYTASWSAAAAFQCASTGALLWLSLKSNPLGSANDMVLANGNDASDLSTCYWTGSAWGNLNTHDTSIDTATTRVFDFAWEDTGSKGLLVYGTTAGQITYKTFTAPNTWSGATSVAMGGGADVHAWVRLDTNRAFVSGNQKILGAVLETTANDLGAIKWDGTTFAIIGANTFTADTGTSTYESFDLKYEAAVHSGTPKQLDWTGAA